MGHWEGAAFDFAEAFNRRQALCDLRANGHHDHRAVGGRGDGGAPPRGADRRIRIRQCRHFERREGERADLRRGDGIARRLHVVGYEDVEDLRRRHSQIQQADRQGGRGLEEVGARRRRRTVWPVLRPHRAIHRFPPRTGAAGHRSQSRRRPRMGRQRRQPLGAQGAQQGSGRTHQDLSDARNARLLGNRQPASTRPPCG